MQKNLGQLKPRRLQRVCPPSSERKQWVQLTACRDSQNAAADTSICMGPIQINLRINFASLLYMFIGLNSRCHKEKSKRNLVSVAWSYQLILNFASAALASVCSLLYIALLKHPLHSGSNAPNPWMSLDTTVKAEDGALLLPHALSKSSLGCFQQMLPVASYKFQCWVITRFPRPEGRCICAWTVQSVCGEKASLRG